MGASADEKMEAYGNGLDVKDAQIQVKNLSSKRYKSHRRFPERCAAALDSEAYISFLGSLRNNGKSGRRWRRSLSILSSTSPHEMRIRSHRFPSDCELIKGAQ